MLKKLLFSLGTLGVVGGTGVGVYYLKGKSSSEKDVNVVGGGTLPDSGSEGGDTSQQQPSRQATPSGERGSENSLGTPGAGTQVVTPGS